jgi:flagellar export protein FliJ
MKKFEFRLESVLRWKESTLRQREAELQQMIHLCSRLRQSLQALHEERSRAEAEFRAAPALLGRDAQQMSEYGDSCVVREHRLRADMEAAERRADAARLAYQEAKRNVKLLSILKSKAMDNWQAELWKDTEQMAGESYLSAWVRRGE